MNLLPCRPNPAPQVRDLELVGLREQLAAQQDDAKLMAAALAWPQEVLAAQGTPGAANAPASAEAAAAGGDEHTPEASRKSPRWQLLSRSVAAAVAAGRPAPAPSSSASSAAGAPAAAPGSGQPSGAALQAHANEVSLLKAQLHQAQQECGALRAKATALAAAAAAANAKAAAAEASAAQRAEAAAESAAVQLAALRGELEAASGRIVALQREAQAAAAAEQQAAVLRAQVGGCSQRGWSMLWIVGASLRTVACGMQPCLI